MELTQQEIQQRELKAKAESMPVTQKELLKKKASKMSSGMDLSTVSSCQTNKYAEPMERLQWGEDVPLTDKHVKMFETCNKFNQEDTKTHYDYIASNYEGMYLRMGYPDPKFCAKYVQKLAKKNEQNPAEAKVLDLGCGTGLIGNYLAGAGFKNIVGLDISPNMLEEASNKCVYKELHEHTLNEPHEFPDKFKNKFDFVTCSGLVNSNFMDYQLFEEMLLACKKGGYVVFSARYSYMGHFWYDKIIKEMHDDGRWELILTDTFFKYDKLDCISVGRFSRTPSKVFVFKKTQDQMNIHMDKNDETVRNFIKSKTFVEVDDADE